MLGCIVSVGLIVAAASPATRPASRPAADREAISVMTFNIRYGEAKDGENRWELRRDLLCDVIREHDPDVIGLQEAIRFQLDYIRKALPGYDEIGAGRNDGQKGGEYSAILYRADRLRLDEHGNFWFSDTPEVPGSKHWGNRITRLCTWGRFIDRRSGRAFYMYNVHLDHESQPSRERSVELLAERVRQRAHPDCAIVTGDFNAGESNRAVRYLKGEIPRASTAPAAVVASPRLRDSFRVIHPDARVVGTFNGFHGTRTGEKIDYILVPADVTVLDAAILRDHRDGRYPSDHFPLIARLRM